MRGLSFAFMIVLGLAVALSVQVVGALLVLSLLITPAAAAARVTASPVLLALGSSIPISPYVTTISFVLYAGCAAAGRHRDPAPGRPAYGVRLRRPAELRSPRPIRAAPVRPAARPPAPCGRSC
ncbi:metal ABC transporter permease [Streptomyces sp. NPDC102270]|uniref:metal ABC transporter permease n=1 Tax=Streptomyces sp. NPDC102270 TaxID=3366150 RepID=UPI0038142BA2